LNLRKGLASGLKRQLEEKMVREEKEETRGKIERPVGAGLSELDR